MPTKRRFVIFVIVLAVMILIKRALGQEEVAWDPQHLMHGTTSADIEFELYSPMLAGVVWGVISGLIRVRNRIWIETYAQESAANIIQLHHL